LKKVVIGVFAVLLVVGIAIAYFAFQPPNTVQIRFAGVDLNVELATSPSEQAKGLSGRDSMPANHGMLFIFGAEGNWSFWMNGMKFPLDIIWFNSNRQVVFIEQGLQPCGPNECPSFSPSTAAMYVLEVNAGFVSTHGVSTGDTFTIVLP
jgi:uncharacterized membrane protein (UPF0127 family)